MDSDKQHMVFINMLVDQVNMLAQIMEGAGINGVKNDIKQISDRYKMEMNKVEGYRAGGGKSRRQRRKSTRRRRRR